MSSKREKDFYSKITRQLVDADLDGAFEVKLIRGRVYRPSILEKAQMFILMSSGLASHKIADVGIHQKFLDIVICRKKYLVLIWEDYSNTVTICDPIMAQGELFKQTMSFTELCEKPYCKILI